MRKHLLESGNIVGELPIVEPENLFIEIAEKMERPHVNESVFDSAFEQPP